MYLFNPENDLALANFTPNYTPPASAIKMAQELSILPIWYAHNAKVVAEGEVNHSFLQMARDVLPVTASLVSFSEMAECCPEAIVVPWGWNPALRKKLLSLGFAPHRLPQQEDLERLRDYSNRRHAVRTLRELQSEREGFFGESYFFTDADELFAWLPSVQGNKVLKMPLSGSGKGLVWVLNGITDKQRDWCRRVLREQGGIVAEPVLSKVQDVAMEFYLQEGASRFVGYSLFSAASSGAYKSNLLLSDRRIEEELSAYIDTELLHWLRHSLLNKLPSVFPHYTGYMGVDMMVCKTPQGFSLQPCVEINVRMNMGVVAHTFNERFVHSAAEGEFVVDYFRKNQSALSFHIEMQRESPLNVVEGKIRSGYMSLTPVTETTSFIVYVKLG